MLKTCFEIIPGDWAQTIFSHRTAQNRFIGKTGGVPMKIKWGKSLLKRFLLACSLGACLNTTAAQSEEVREFTIDGGMVMRTWPEADTVMPFVVRLRTPDESPQRRLPAQIILLIDASRDMQGESARYARESARLVIDKLKAGDLVGVVTFAEHATVVSPMQPLNDRNRRSIGAAIDGFHEGSERNLSAGFDKIPEQFARFKGQDAAARFVFLITNGDPNAGITDPAGLHAKASLVLDECKASLSTFGIEEHYSEELLIPLAQQNGGRYYFAQEPKLLVSRIDAELNRAAFPAVKDIALSITPPGKTALTNIQGGRREDNLILVGDMGAGEERIVCFTIDGRPSRQKDCVVKVSYREPDAFNPRTERIYLPTPLTTGKSEYDAQYAPKYLVSAMMHTLASKSAAIATDRRGFTNFFRVLADDLNQENVTLNSDYIRKTFDYFAELDKVLTNTAIEDELVIKEITFKSLETLRGN